MSRPVLFTSLALILSLIAPAAPAVAGDASPIRLAKLDSSQTFAAGQVAGLFGSGLSLSTAGADRVVVVAVEPEPSDDDRVPVALIGKLPISVIGPVRAGDLVFASGRHDGSAAGVSPSDVTPAKLPLLVGRALETNPVGGARPVEVLIGVSEWEVLVEILEARDALLEAQELELVALRARLAELEELDQTVEALRQSTERLVALEAARESEELAPLPLDADGR
ncbi:MAG: hypothetical protein ACE5GX_10920 [Thermoanaerobaculia bacterium]